MGNYIISLKTLEELVARDQVILCCSLDQFARPSEMWYELKDIIESQHMTFSEFLWTDMMLWQWHYETYVCLIELLLYSLLLQIWE